MNTTIGYDPTPPRTLSSSIWAPQPQPSETTWPKTLDSFQREAMYEHHLQAHPQHPHAYQAVRREDVFGQQQQQQPMRAPGAIGDGRKKSPGELQHADTHVEQLLRTLNLNSPVPANAKKCPPPALSLNLSRIPQLSRLFPSERDLLAYDPHRPLPIPSPSL
ncbi:hypothetical protein C0991_009218 [Blastosporella zonata]|nr:hypothetical protein C0991_009218 [Blastosporella zonata]